MGVPRIPVGRSKEKEGEGEAEGGVVTVRGGGKRPASKEDEEGEEVSTFSVGRKGIELKTSDCFEVSESPAPMEDEEGEEVSTLSVDRKGTVLKTSDCFEASDSGTVEREGLKEVDRGEVWVGLEEYLGLNSILTTGSDSEEDADDADEDDGVLAGRKDEEEERGGEGFLEKEVFAVEVGRSFLRASMLSRAEGRDDTGVVWP